MLTADKRLEKDTMSYLDIDFPDFAEITDKIREENKKRVFTGGVRINAGKYRTKAEDEKYRKDSLSRKLP